MIEEPTSKLESTLDQFTGKRALGADGKPKGNAGADDFTVEFARLKLTVIRPAFENIGNLLKERGHDIKISEESNGKIAIHIVPAGVNKSIHPYDWFPTFSFFGAPFTKSVGLHGRNMRPNSEGSSGARGDYKLAQVSKDVVEKELMKFIGEIANW